MINVSNEFKQLMNERTDFKCNADITLTDGTVLQLDASAFTLSNNSITDAAGANTLPLGVAVGRSIQIELLNDEEQYKDIDFFGAKIRLYLTFKLSTTTEKIEMGTFTVLDPETYGETVIITAQDDMYKADKEYTTTLTFPATLSAMYIDACTNCSIPFVTAAFPNSDFVVNEAPSDATYREVFGYIAMLAVGNARVNRSGYMDIISYDFETVHHSLTEWRDLKADMNDIVITGVQTVVEHEDEEGNTTEETILNGEEGYVIAIENPLIAGKEQDAVDIIAAALVGVSFRKFSGDYIAYPIAEFMDVVEITNRKGETYKSVLTDIDFVFFGFTTMSNSAESVLRNGAVYQGEASKAIVAAKKLVEREKTQRELAVEKLNKSLAQSSGMYQTSEVQEDGSTIYYLHDKPTIEESANVIKLTAEAIGLSTDGGKTYPYGFMLTGDMIAKILSAEGINADWINVGAFTVKDSEGNIVFKADVTTGEIIIDGKNGKVQFENTPIYTFDETVYPVAEYSEDDLTRVISIILGDIEPTEEDFAKYDFYRDGKITNTDLIGLRNMLNAGADHVVSWKVSLDPTNNTNILRIWRESTIGANDTLITELFNVGIGGGRLMLGDPVEDADAISKGYMEDSLAAEMQIVGAKPQYVSDSNYAITTSDAGKKLSFAYTIRNEAITVTLEQSVSVNMPVGAEIAIVRSWGAAVTIQTSGIRLGLPGTLADGTGGLTTTDAQTFAISKPFGTVILKKIENSDTGDVWIVQGDVDSAGGDSDKLTITGGEEIPIELKEGEILQVTYLTSVLTAGNITLKVNGAAPDGSYYSPLTENNTYTGGIITYGGTNTYASAQFFMQIVRDRLLVWGTGIRGNSSGSGLFNAFWKTTEPTSFSISKAGTVRYQKLSQSVISGESDGSGGTDGVGISSIDQTVTSEESGGVNEITVSLTDGRQQVFEVRNGQAGYTPQKGTDYWTEADKAEMVKALGGTFADYIIEIGETNGWKWEKWNSGKFICWGTFNDTRTHYTTVNGFYGYYSSDFEYPITFPEAPIVHFNCKVGSGFAAPAGDVARSTVQARCYALSTASGEVTCYWELYVVGRWK